MRVNEQVEIKVEVVTPLFMSGADQNIAELRPPSFKGMMRWWWRAAMCENNIEALKSEEARLWGGAGEKQGKSKISIRIDKVHNQMHPSSPAWKEKPGIKYLLYSVVALKNPRPYINPCEIFTIRFSGERDFMKQALASLWLSIYLGGFGSRCRRGAGALTVVEQPPVMGEGELNFVVEAATLEEAKRWLCENIHKAISIIRENGKGAGRFTEKYSNLAGAKVMICGPFNSWEWALDKFGQEYRNLRRINNPSGRAMLGLPVQGMSCGVSRRASPLWVSVLKSKSPSQFFLTVLRLRGKFLDYSRYSGFRHDEFNKFIDDFWGKLKNKLNGRECIIKKLRP